MQNARGAQPRDLVDVAVLVETPVQNRQRRLTVRGRGNDVWWRRWAPLETTASPRSAPGSRLMIPGA